MGNIYLIKYVLVFFAALTSLDNVIAVADDPGKESVCKVNKGLIQLYSTGLEGIIIVEGGEGAISSTSSVSGYVQNLTTEEKTVFVPSDTMAFSVKVNAKAGDKIRVYAKNADSKRSYGTFNVSGNMIEQQVQIAGNSASNAVKEYSQQEEDIDGENSAIKASVESTTFFPKLEIEKTDQTDIGTNLAVVIMIVNTDSGEVVSTTQVTGKSKTYADKSEKNFNIMIQRIITRCTNIIESEIFRPDLPRSEMQEAGTVNQQE